MEQTIVTGAFTLGGVIVGSLLAPWVTWTLVEKKREQRAHRRELLRSWREGIGEYAGTIDIGEGGDYTRTAWYASLHPYLRPDLRVAGGNVVKVQLGGGLGSEHMNLATEVSRIEKEWGLA